MTQTTAKTVLSALKKRASKELSGSGKKDFLIWLDDFYQGSTPADLLGEDPDRLYTIAHQIWETAEKRKPRTAIIEVLDSTVSMKRFNTDHSVILIINDDMPFLVDSVSKGLSVSLRQRLHMMHHPQLVTSRDKNGTRLNTLAAKKGTGTASRRSDPADGVRESVMYIEVDAQSGKANLAELKTALKDILDDVRASVEDWRGMLAKIDETVASLTVNPPPVPEGHVEETIKFLRWLGGDHFTFLGFQEYRFEDDPETSDYKLVKGSGLGILRAADRYVLRGVDGLTAISAEIRHFLSLPEPVVITKANVKTRVHRPVHMDYVGVKIFDDDGKVIGERRFVGLFTSLSYSRSSFEVPLLRTKTQHVIDAAPFDKRTHIGKVLAHILETFPRDELFQVSTTRLQTIAMGVVQLSERPRPRAFIRRDKFERFVSALIYVPRENYNAGLREKIGEILCSAFNGEVSVYYALLSEDSLARWHFIIRTTPGKVGKPSEEAINEAIAAAAIGWTDGLQHELVSRYGEEDGMPLYQKYQDRFPISYREAFDPSQAAIDVSMLEALTDKVKIKFDFYRHVADGDDHYRLKIHHGSRVVPLSDCLPMLENLGFRVIGEYTYKISNSGGAVVHDFTLERSGDLALSMADMKPLIQEALTRSWSGVTENDGFSELVLTCGMPWADVLILRAIAKYLRQLGMSYSPDYVEDCLVEHADIAQKLVSLFKSRLDPKGKSSRDEDCKGIRRDLLARFDKVSVLDQDRILRAYENVISNILRTNYWQDGVIEGADERAFAFKIRSRNVDEAPLPRPFAEIFVYSPRLEGVHLRGGPVARGGLRWSDRREDFRTEILGLVKAQQVKNAVIVPQGAKGGFFPKYLNPSMSRDEYMDEGIASYRSFISSLLSVTDNLKDGDIVKPDSVLRTDGDDPYLVVAADKGTATFSDISNGIAIDKGFWLGDAFASGGSNGYDHKGMGITAKGAWVSVQRHFREIGINTQTDPISVIGIGDMAGDVFGNGMLLSKTIELKAAFNHLHIFLDPTPKDAKANWKERKRLFDKPRSSWEDYKTDLISKGGGVFSRSEKSIPLSTEVKEWLGVDADVMAPNALLKAILMAEADLLWFGGIGTYVRASNETDAQVGDRANDALRVTPDQLNVKAIGEGGNLGMTQLSRIEFARLGGSLNTDFIDNSAGVDCSDKEVNIKILLKEVIDSDKLSSDERDSLLAEMTDDVSRIVLSDNYLQTQAISLAEAQAVPAREYHMGLIKTLERDGGLNREIETLPSDEQFAELAAAGQGLTRPEIATLMAYAKMSLNDILIKSPLLDDEILLPELEWGFPPVLNERYAEEMQRHRLKKEIIATVLANEVVNWAGLTFVYEVKEETGLAVDDIVAAFVVIREIYDLQDIWNEINALDYKIEASTQSDMHMEVSSFLKHQVMWLLRNMPHEFDMSKTVKRFKPALEALISNPSKALSESTLRQLKARRVDLQDQAVPLKLATRIAALMALRQAPDIISVSEESGENVEKVAASYFQLGDIVGFEWLRQTSEKIVPDDHWELLAVRSIMDDLADQQRELVSDVVTAEKNPGEGLKAWQKAQETRLIRADRLVGDLKSSGAMTVAKLGFASRHLRSILR